MATSGDTWAYANPVPLPIQPLTMVTPFTYRDGTTYLEVQQNIVYYIQNTLIPQINQIVTTAQDNLNSGVTQINTAEAQWSTDMNNFMANINAQLQALNDSAMAALINSPTSATSEALAPLYAAKSAVDALQALTDTGRLSQSALDGVYAKLADFNTLSSTVSTGAVKWVPGLSVTAGQVLVSPDGEVVKAFEAHTTGQVYNPANYYSDYGFLFANFTYNSIQGEQLNLFYSGDGQTVTGHGPNPVYTSAHGVRDPSIIKFNGKWILAHGWDDPTQKKFSVCTSNDLVNWSETAVVDCSTSTGITQAWAPELTVDENGNLYAFFTNVTSAGMEIWYVSCTDTGNFASWSGPVALQWTSKPVKAMDATFQKVNGSWHMFYGDNNYVCHASATALLGPWTSDKVGDWAGWGINREAPELVRVGASKWRLYIDRYEGTSPNWTYPGYAYTESTDLNTWTPLTPVVLPRELSQIVLRHGSFVRIDDRATAGVVQGVMASGAAYHAHVEATSTVSVAGGGTETPLGAYTVDAQMSDAVTSLYDFSAAGSVKVNATGKYSIDFHVGEDGTNNFQNSATMHWVSIHGDTMGRNLAQNVASAGYELSCSASAVFLRAGEVITPKVLQSSGASQTLIGRVRITRVG